MKLVKRYEFKNKIRIIITLGTPNWYHNFKDLGVQTNQYSDKSYAIAQKNKSKVLNTLIEKEINRIKLIKSKVDVVEHFCADGYYGQIAVYHGANKVYGVDLAGDSSEKRESVLDQAKMMDELLNNGNRISFFKQDVFDFNTKVDLALVIGGLYHIKNPEKFLVQLNKYVENSIIIQSIVLPDFYEGNNFLTPAPNWDWGCRFKTEYLVEILEKNGWEIDTLIEDIATWNQAITDKGNVYVLARKKQ